MSENLVRRTTNFIKEYQDTLREKYYVPKTSFQRESLGFCGDAHKLFLTFLFGEPAIGVQFVKDAGIIRSNMLCNSRGRDMTWYADPSVIDGFRC
jgi:hypothetical protein